MTLITTNDAIIKHLTQVFGIGQIMFLRGMLICILFAAIMRFRQLPIISGQSFNKWNITRALLELAATFTFLTGLSLLPIATASTLGFSSPIFLAILATVLLGERVDALRWLVIIAGFCGVLIITNPFQDEINWAVVLPVTCAFFVALRDMVIRYVPDTIPSMQVAFTNAWVVTIGGGLVSMFQGWGQADWTWYLWFVGLSCAIFGGYYFYIEGSRLGELSFIGPFKYVSVLLAILFGYLFWNEIPGWPVLIGAAVIIFSGVLLLTGENRKATRAERAAPGIE